jgi:hypothetical protein
MAKHETTAMGFSRVRPSVSKSQPLDAGDRVVVKVNGGRKPRYISVPKVGAADMLRLAGIQ